MIIKRIRIIIADDHQMVREGLRLLLRALQEVDVVGEAADGREVVHLAKELMPDVIVMDIAMPGLNGIDATRQILEKDGATKIIALSGRATDRSAADVLLAGASAFVRKESAFAELKDALREVMANRIYVSPAVKNTVVINSLIEHKPHVRPLSTREREVLQLTAEGKSTKETARQLSVSIKTIETHRRNLMEKLQVFSVAELTKYAIREGLTTI